MHTLYLHMYELAYVYIHIPVYVFMQIYILACYVHESMNIIKSHIHYFV